MSYRGGKYGAEPALDFTDRIIEELDARPNLAKGRGLYAGCGNGRNYVKLAKSGLDVTGIDVSGVAIGMLSKRIPQFAASLCRCDFLDYANEQHHKNAPFQYVIAIQVFQHGNLERVEKYFEKISMLLERGGLLFLRVNASNTTIQHDHDVIERNGSGGFTVRYNGGPKKGLDIRFFSKEDVVGLVRKNDMSVIRKLKNVTTRRVRPGTGSWSQWEVVTRKD